MIVFLDACAIIYRVEAVEPYASRANDVLKRFRARHPETALAVSRLSLLECRVKPFRERNQMLLAKYERFFSAPDLVIVGLDDAVVDRATLIRAESSLPTPDALQAACALSLAGDVLFVTNDREFKRVAGLTVKLL